MMEKEIWKSIPDFEHYSISNYGNILGPYKLRKKKIAKNGKYKYLIIELHKNGVFKQKSVANIVAKVFLGAPMNKKFSVRFINGDYSDCSVHNIKLSGKHQKIEEQQ